MEKKIGSKKEFSVMFKEAGVLFAITLVAGLLLGFVYELTKGPIAEQEKLAVQNACREVFADAASFEEVAFTPDFDMTITLQEDGVKIGTCYNALDAQGNILGVVVESVSSEGYGGNIRLYMGVRSDGTLNDVSILEISETAGLGMEAENVLVPQFHNKQVDSFTYTKTGSSSDSEIDAISGATITTKAVINAVNDGMKVAEQLNLEGKIARGGDSL